MGFYRDSWMQNKSFDLKADYKPAGDQGEAIKNLLSGIDSGKSFTILEGVTGSGKTFTMANVMAKAGRPALIISHNKTLAAQLFSEFKEYFPNNAVGYFVSYYDYYQPEAYLPGRDLYIEKDSSINDEIDRLRLLATSELMERRDVVIIASVSCIFGLGSPDDFKDMRMVVTMNQDLDRAGALRHLVDLQYRRNDVDFQRGTVRVRGDVLDIFPAYGQTAMRIEFDFDTVRELSEFDPVSGRTIRRVPDMVIYPAKHYLMRSERREAALCSINRELVQRLGELRKANLLLEAERLEKRTKFDMEMIRESGTCAGIENYSRHLSGRSPGERPWTLLDYFPDDLLVFIDESHVTLPQIRAMYNGDRARKKNLVDYGFRLPSAYDNRPLKYEEFWSVTGQTIFVSATPGPEEKKRSGLTVRQWLRPTGLVDPVIHIRPVKTQVDDVLAEVNMRISRSERSLVVTLTKKMAESLADYMIEAGFKVRYLHSSINTIERVEILKELRDGDVDVIIGVNLLREGLDLPEVSLVAILDADREGFLRSETSLIQTSGRAARNVNGEVILYADRITGSIRRAMDIMNSRREKQLEYNARHGIKPVTIRKTVRKLLQRRLEKTEKTLSSLPARVRKALAEEQVPGWVYTEMEREMTAAAEKLDFERAAFLRDEIARFEKKNKEDSVK